MNTKTIYTILAVVVMVVLGYYFINNQTPISQLPVNNNIDEPTITEPVQNEPGDTLISGDDDEHLTYTSNLGGYSIDYPKDWYWDATRSWAGVMLSRDENESSVPGLGGPRVSVTVYRQNELHNNPDNLGLGAWLETVIADVGYTKVTEITVDGTKGYQGVEHGMWSKYTIYVIKDSLVYRMSSRSEAPDTIEQKILNSFKFI